MNDQIECKKSEVSSDETILIPWSGGFDSTALLLKNIEESNKIETVSTWIENNRVQMCAEEVSRNKIRHYLNNELKSSITLTETKVGETFQYSSSHSHKYEYPKHIVYSCLLAEKTPKEIQIGYVGSDRRAEGFNLDQHTMLIPSISALWKLSRTDKCPDVTFPFYDKNKVELLEYYKKPLYRPIFYMISTCAFGYDYKSGCRCAKCTKLYELQRILESSI